MEIKRTTEIFVKTQRRFVIHQPDPDERISCCECGAGMLTAEQAAALFHLGRRAVYRHIEDSRIHFTETELAVVMICPNSLAWILNNEPHEINVPLEA